MGSYLTEGTLPRDEFDELIKVEAKNFTLNDRCLYRWLRDGIMAPLLGIVVPRGLYPADAQQIWSSFLSWDDEPHRNSGMVVNNSQRHPSFSAILSELPNHATATAESRTGV